MPLASTRCFCALTIPQRVNVAADSVNPENALDTASNRRLTRQASHSIGNFRRDHVNAAGIRMKRREAISRKTSCFPLVGSRADDDLLQGSRCELAPVEFPIADERSSAPPVFHRRRRFVAAEELLKPVFFLVLARFVLKKHDATNDIHRVIDQQVHHVGVKWIATYAGCSRQAYQRDRSDQLELSQFELAERRHTLYEMLNAV